MDNAPDGLQNYALNSPKLFRITRGAPRGFTKLRAVAPDGFSELRAVTPECL